MEPDTEESPIVKEERLKGIIAAYGALAVAYSGEWILPISPISPWKFWGKTWLFIADTPSFPRSELSFALELPMPVDGKLRRFTPMNFRVRLS